VDHVADLAPTAWRCSVKTQLLIDQFLLRIEIPLDLAKVTLISNKNAETVEVSPSPRQQDAVSRYDSKWEHVYEGENY
jgi:hypothetical protein